MASLAHLSLTFFFLLTFTFIPTHSRELKSFNKSLRNEFPSETVTKPEETPALEKEQPENLPSQSQNGYGLYGRGPEEYFPINEQSRNPRTDFSAEIPDSREANAFYPQDESPKEEKYGMSDTRTVENGKYFYDLNNQRHGEAYDPARGSSEGYGVKKDDNGRFGYGVYNYEGRGKGYYGYSREMEGKQNYQNQDIDREEYYDP